MGDDRIIGSANRVADERFCVTTVARFSAPAIAVLEAVIGEGTDVAEGAEAARPEADPVVITGTLTGHHARSVDSTSR